MRVTSRHSAWTSKAGGSRQDAAPGAWAGEGWQVRGAAGRRSPAGPQLSGSASTQWRACPPAASHPSVMKCKVMPQSSSSFPLQADNDAAFQLSSSASKGRALSFIPCSTFMG